MDHPPQSGPPREDPRIHDTVRLSASGLAKVLGDLEVRVLRALWALDRPAPAREVHERVVREHEVALLTVVTVLNKLVDKGLVGRSKREGLLHWEARWGEAELRAHVSRRVVEGILSFAPEAVSASFVDVLAERDREQLLELQRLIRARLEEDGG